MIRADHPLKPLKDPSLWAVIAGNFFAIFFALTGQWDAGEIMWVYWAQSVTIGIMNVFRMLSLKEFTTRGMTMNDQPVPETHAGKMSVVTFFIIHYGFFHFVYAVFLWQELALNEIPLAELLLMALVASGFVGSHSYSLLHNMRRDFKERRPNLGTLMFYPYMRIIPMHLAIIFGQGGGGDAVVILMFLKTFADAGMHVVEHKIFQSPEKENIGVLRD